MESSNSDVNIILANIINVFHIIVILFVLFIPFSNIPMLLLLHIVFSMSLLVHWYNNNNQCSLTLLESKLRGLDVTESFTYKFIAPLYDVSKTDWSKICYSVTIVLMIVSIYRLYNSKRLKDAFRCFSEKRKEQEWISGTFYDKLTIVNKCFIQLFLIS
jgi:hypothetical protein